MKKCINLVIFCIFAIMLFNVKVPVSAQETVNEIVNINHLDDDFVSISKTKIMNVKGVEYKIDKPAIMLFKNSVEGRKNLSESFSEPFVSAVLAVWDEPSKTLYNEKLNISETRQRSEVVEKFYIHYLNDKFVTFMKTTKIYIEDTEYQLEEPWAVSYENSSRGRELFMEDKSIPSQFAPAVMSVWGDSPTVEILVEIKEFEQNQNELEENSSKIQEIQNKI